MEDWNEKDEDQAEDLNAAASSDLLRPPSSLFFIRGTDPLLVHILLTAVQQELTITITTTASASNQNELSFHDLRQPHHPNQDVIDFWRTSVMNEDTVRHFWIFMVLFIFSPSRKTSGFFETLCLMSFLGGTSILSFFRLRGSFSFTFKHNNICRLLFWRQRK